MSPMMGCHAHGLAWACSHLHKTWPLKAVAMAPKGSFEAQSSLGGKNGSHRGGRLLPELLLYGASLTSGEAGQKMSRARKGQDVEPDLIRIAVPLDEEPLFATLNVAVEGAIREAEAGRRFFQFLDRVHDPR